MSELVPIVYYGGLMVLFFFWIYGIASFALDVKHRVVPAIRQYRQNKQRNRSQDTDNERQEREEQLY